MLAILAESVAAQSNDHDKSTSLFNNEVKGRWSNGKAVSYYYNFETGHHSANDRWSCRTEVLAEKRKLNGQAPKGNFTLRRGPNDSGII